VQEDSIAMKTEAFYLSTMSISIYHLTWCDLPEEFHFTYSVTLQFINIYMIRVMNLEPKVCVYCTFFRVSFYPAWTELNFEINQNRFLLSTFSSHHPTYDTVQILQFRSCSEKFKVQSMILGYGKAARLVFPNFLRWTNS